MVTLALSSNFATRQIITAAMITNPGDFIVGTDGYGQLFRPYAITDATNYSTIVGNQDTTNGRALQVQYGLIASPTILAQFTKAATILNVTTSLKQIVTPADPGATYTGLYAKNDSNLYYFPTGGAETRIGTYAQTPTSILTTTGDTLYASAANTPARLAIGTTNFVLGVVGGIPAWIASPTSVLSGTGDLLTTSGANTLSRLAIGTARQALTVNSGATGLTYVSSLQSLMTAQGDIVQASAANTPARLAIGTAFQGPVVNSGATALQYSSCAIALAAASGDIFYATGANALAKLAKGSDGQFLKLASGIPAWTTASGSTLPTLSAALSADILLNSTGTYFVGPAVSLTAGTWFVFAEVTVTDTAAATFGAKLTDGSTIARTTSVTLRNGNDELAIILFGFITVGSTTSWSIQIRDQTTTNGKVLAASAFVAGGNNASHIEAFQVA